MFLVVILLLYAILTCFLYGIAILEISSRILKIRQKLEDIPLELVVLSGFPALAFLLGVVSLFSGLSTRVHLLMFSGAVVIVYVYRKLIVAMLKRGLPHPAFSGPLSLLLVVVLIVLLIQAVSGTFTYDNGLYHAQIIKWQENYSVVPGLANLHGRLGFNSVWFLLATFFGFGKLGLETYFLPGLLLSLCFNVYLFRNMRGIVHHPSMTGLASAGFLLAELIILTDKESFPLSSPNMDWPAIILTFLVVLLFLQAIEEKKNNMLIILLFTILAVTIKFSTIPLVLIPLYLLVISAKDFRYFGIWYVALLVFMLTLPWFIRTIITTGYLLFPFLAIDVFSFDWKVPAELVQTEVVGIVRSFSRLNSLNPFLAQSMPFVEWFPIWWRNQNWQDIVLLVSVFFSIFIYLGVYLRERLRGNKKFFYGRELFLFIILFLGIVFWFWQAPSFRFGYGFLYSLLVIALARGILKHMEKIPAQSVYIRGAFGALVIAFILLNFPSLPTRLSDINIDTRTEVVNGLAVYVPLEGDQCWYNQFPCSPYSTEKLSLRGNTFAEGFRYLP